MNRGLSMPQTEFGLLGVEKKHLLLPRFEFRTTQPGAIKYLFSNRSLFKILPVAKYLEIKNNV
jgi:hypothetical protein